MAIALRPRPSASTMSSRYGSHALALGARPGGRRGPAPESVDTSARGWPSMKWLFGQAQIFSCRDAQHRVIAKRVRRGRGQGSRSDGHRPLALDAARSRGHIDHALGVTSCLNRVFALPGA